MVGPADLQATTRAERSGADPQTKPKNDTRSRPPAPYGLALPVYVRAKSVPHRRESPSGAWAGGHLVNLINAEADLGGALQLRLEDGPRRLRP